MRLKNYLAAALFIVGASWLWVMGSQQAGAERQAVASEYSLGAQQLTVYDKCISAIEQKHLRAGGSNQRFCGCWAQNGLGSLSPDESDVVLGWIKNRVPKPAMITERQNTALVAALACVEDTRSKWTSVAAMQSWCAEKDDRRELPQCKLKLK